MPRGGHRNVGGKPVPTRLKILRGNPGHRPLNDQEPIPEKPSKVPRAPRHLRDAAKKEWRRIAPVLLDLGLLTEIDTVALAAYCEVYASWVDASTSLAKTGTIITSGGVVKANPLVNITSKFYDQMRAMLAEFGMTPSSRSRVKVVNKKKEDDNLKKFIGG